MKFTVIIPTRERADTLYHSLRTCVGQNYDNLTILVSDNCSADNTREIVDSFKDSRIQYINTGSRVSMTSNWEFALGHVKEGYFTFIGDDDGLLPEALDDVRKLIASFGTAAISWLKVDYRWPCHPIAPDYMRIPLNNILTRTNARKVVYAITKGMCGYDRSPCVYNSFVDVKLAHHLKNRTGRFFYSMTPDVYSSLAYCSVLDSFYYSTRPFSVNGGSRHSNGVNSGVLGINQNDQTNPAVRFLAEIDMETNEEFPLVFGSMYSAVFEAFAQANRYCFGNRLPLNRYYWFYLLAKELSGKPPEIYNEGMSMLKLKASSYGHKLMTTFLEHAYPRALVVRNDVPTGLDERALLHLDTSGLNINNVYDASVFAGNLLGGYKRPLRIRNFSISGLFVSFFKRRLNRLIA